MNPPYMGAVVGLPADEEIAQRVMTEMLPMLRNALSNMRALQEVWLVNGMAQQVAAAVQATPPTPIAGYAAADWAAWGTVLTELLAWLDQPIESIGATPRQILQKRYVKAGAE
jgi:hypothetical protein